jgi:hypothetical protein
MYAKRHPIDHFIHYLAFSHLACRTAIPAVVEASTRKDQQEGREASRGGGDGGKKGSARPAWRAIGQRLAALRAVLRLPLPSIDIRRAYAATAPRTVTSVTSAWRCPKRRMCLDSALAATTLSHKR